MFKINYEKYSKRVIKKLNIIQNNFRKKYKIDSYDNWFYNQSSGLLRFYNDDGEKEIFFKYVPIGTYSTNSKTWLWSWANEYSVEQSKYDTLKVKEFGEKKKYKNLNNGYFENDAYIGWELTAISFQILNGIGAYRVKSENLEIYFLITKQIEKEDVKKIEDELIECIIHGKIRKAFICQHLNKEKQTGFEEAFDTKIGMKLLEDDDFQAWCSDCEKERIKSDGWNEISMEYAKIKIVCERCYFEIKEFNLK